MQLTHGSSENVLHTRITYSTADEHTDICVPAGGPTAQRFVRLARAPGAVLGLAFGGRRRARRVYNDQNEVKWLVKEDARLYSHKTLPCKNVKGVFCQTGERLLTCLQFRSASHHSQNKNIYWFSQSQAAHKLSCLCSTFSILFSCFPSFYLIFLFILWKMRSISKAEIVVLYNYRKVECSQNACFQEADNLLSGRKKK